jgi:hypothetical protein
MRLLIADFEAFRRAAADVMLPASSTLMNVRISSKRQFIDRCWLARAVLGTSSPQFFAISTVIERYQG